MHTCKVSVRDLVEFILRSGDIVSSSTGIRDTDAMQEGTRIHKKLQKQMGSQYHAEVPLKYTSSVCYDNLSFAISVEGRADGIFPKALLPRLYDFADFSSEIPLETEAEHTHPIIPCRTIIHDDSEAPTDFIDEIKGIYVPFWLFDAQVAANISYKGERTRTWSDAKYKYIEHNYYRIYRAGYVAFDQVPVDGSKKMADDLMESIEPFNISGAVDFQTAYLAGYLADKYDVTAEQSIERANKRVKHSTEEAFAETVKGYATVTTDNSSVQFHGGKAKYALYPVWLLNTTWNGNKYTFAMNGQTGKFVGDLPVDKGAAARWTVMLAAVFSVVTYGAAWLLHLIGLF